MFRTVLLFFVALSCLWSNTNLTSVVDKVYSSTVNIYLVTKIVKYSVESEKTSTSGKITRVLIPVTKVSRKAIGSGVIVSKDGYVITNSHVIAAGMDFAIGTSDNRVFDVKVLYDYSERDLAILKIKDKDFKLFKKSQVAKFGDSSKTKVGDQVIAIGTPLGSYYNTVQQGIISGKAKALPDIHGRRYQNLIQISAELNYGNSGGPLFNMDGEIIGINSCIDPRGRSIGFAVPGNIAKRAFLDFKKHKRVQVTFVGLKGKTLNESLIKKNKLTNGIGVYITKIIRKSPASKAGLKKGDVIYSVNGRELKGYSCWRGMLQEFPNKTLLKLKIIRKGKILRKEMKVSTVESALKQNISVYESYNPPVDNFFDQLFKIPNLGSD